MTILVEHVTATALTARQYKRMISTLTKFPTRKDRCTPADIFAGTAYSISAYLQPDPQSPELHINALARSE
jgi:hypothetical protein